MPNDRVTDLLDEFAAVSASAPRPPSPARLPVVRGAIPVATLAGAVLIVAALAVGGFLGRPPAPLEEAAASPSATASPSPTAVPSTTASPSPTVGLSATPRPSEPVAEATPQPIDGCDLAARITGWDGAAGQRIATVELLNRGAVACMIDALPRPQLVDGRGNVLIDGRPMTSDRVLTLDPDARATTLVAAGNWCGPTPQPPVSVAFVSSSGARLVAAPLIPTDLTMPPCNGPGQPPTIEMHPWAP